MEEEMTKIKVFHLIYALNLAGIEAVVTNWYRHIDRNKIQFDFGVMEQYDTPVSSEIKKLGGKIYIVPAGHGLYKRLNLLWHLYRTLKKYGPYDVFQSHDHFFAGFTCMVAWFAGVKKRITFSHFSDGLRQIGFFENLKRMFSRFLISLFATECLAISDLAGIALYGKYLKFHVLSNGIDTGKFEFDQKTRYKVRKELNIENKFVVGHVGRFSKEKNHSFLIDVFNEIYKKDKKAALLLVGDGYLRIEIEEKVQSLKLRDNVIFTGSKSNVCDYYQLMDVFVFSSFFEGLSVVSIEAQCSGLLCFISDGVPDEAMICNTTKIPLSKSAKEWADIILEKTKNFERKDCSEIIKKVGFDIKDTVKKIEKIYLEKSK